MLVQRLQPGFLQLGCVEVSSSDTDCYSELSPQNTFCCYPWAMQTRCSYFSLGAGGINFLQSKQCHRKQKQEGQLGKANSQAASSMEQHWAVQTTGTRDLSCLAPQDDQQQKCVLKLLWSFHKLVTATLWGKYLCTYWFPAGKVECISSTFASLLFSQDIAKNYLNYHFVTRMVNSSLTNQAVWHSIPLTNLWVCGLAELCWYASNFQFTAVYCPWADVFRTIQTPEKS